VENAVIILFACVAGIVALRRLTLQLQERQRAITDKALESQAVSLRMQERSLAIEEETLKLHRETNDLLRRLVEKP
jgi:hypothetical protein